MLRRTACPAACFHTPRCLAGSSAPPVAGGAATSASPASRMMHDMGAGERCHWWWPVAKPGPWASKAKAGGADTLQEVAHASQTRVVHETERHPIKLSQILMKHAHMSSRAR